MPDRIIDMYRRHALDWDRIRGKSLFERPWLDRFLALTPSPAPQVLDLGCGSAAPLAAYLIDQGARVTGLDSAPAMVAIARARFPDHLWLVGDMRCPPLVTKFDAILAWDSFFHLDHDDQRRMFPLFRDLASPGAALMFTSGPEHGIAMGEMWGEAVHHASLSPTEYRALLAENGFQVAAFTAHDPQCGGHTIWLAQAQA